jgi:predicted site-specific integrase-resolvase
MQATHHSTACPVPASTLLTIADAADRFGVHPWTLRDWDRKGLIQSYRVGETGWRRFDPQSIAAHMGLSDESDKQGRHGGPLPCLYARVSSESQDKAGNLKRQIDRMKKEVAAREGCSPRQVQVFSDTASSYGDRPGLNALIEKVIEGKVSRVYCEYADRLSRVPSLTRLVESICRNRGVDVVVIHKEETEDIVQTAMMELVKFAQVIGCKISGQRGANATKRELSQEQLREAYLMKKQGMSFKGIAREAEKREWKDQRGKRLRGDAARALISRRVLANWRILEETYGKDAKPKNSFEEFCDQFVTVSKSQRKVSRGSLAAKYSEWCEENGKLEVAPSTISKVGAKRGWKRAMRGKHVFYVGLSVNVRQGGKARRKAA